MRMGLKGLDVELVRAAVKEWLLGEPKRPREPWVGAIRMRAMAKRGIPRWQSEEDDDATTLGDWCESVGLPRDATLAERVDRVREVHGEEQR